MKTRADAIAWVRAQPEGIECDTDDLDAACRALGYDPDDLAGTEDDPTDRRWDTVCGEIGDGEEVGA